MHKDGLTPTRVVNKNGVATTVHKRAGMAQSSASSSIPKPIIVDDWEVDRLSTKLTLHLHAAMNGMSKTGTGRKRMFATLNPDTMSRLVPLVGEDDSFATPYRKVMSAAVDKKDFSVLNNFALAVAAEGYPDRQRQDHIIQALNGTRMYFDGRGPVIDFTADEVSIPASQAKAVFRALSDLPSDLINHGVMKKSFEFTLTFKDKNLGAFIKENHEHIGSIIALLETGRKFDPDLFSVAVATKSSALIEGVL